jgi:hypothetical protein
MARQHFSPDCLSLAGRLMTYQLSSNGGAAVSLLGIGEVDNSMIVFDKNTAERASASTDVWKGDIRTSPTRRRLGLYTSLCFARMMTILSCASVAQADISRRRYPIRGFTTSRRHCNLVFDEGKVSNVYICSTLNGRCLRVESCVHTYSLLCTHTPYSETAQVCTHRSASQRDFRIA